MADISVIKVNSTNYNIKDETARNCLTASDGTVFQFDVDSNGNYGFIKEGADTVTPFSEQTIEIPESGSSEPGGDELAIWTDTDNGNDIYTMLSKTSNGATNYAFLDGDGDGYVSIDFYYPTPFHLRLFHFANASQYGYGPTSIEILASNDGETYETVLEQEAVTTTSNGGCGVWYINSARYKYFKILLGNHSSSYKGAYCTTMRVCLTV